MAIEQRMQAMAGSLLNESLVNSLKKGLEN